MNRKLHTPRGVGDILPTRCFEKRSIENAIKYIFTSMAYKEVETPTFEYYDIYGSGEDKISQSKMIKFLDENGNLMALRPDITTSIARMAATKDTDCPLPWRYCYTGSVFRAGKTEGARQREFTQSGIELLGSYAPEADAEVIAAAIEALIALGLEDFTVNIGQVMFFNGLTAQAGLSDAEIEQLRARVDAKDKWGIKSLTEKLGISDDIRDLMKDLPYMFGGREILERANVPSLNDTSKHALENIARIYDLLSQFGFEKYVSIDLGMLQSIDYYTGLIFECYTYGVGFPIVTGGRYDNLMGRFGKPMGAVGAAADIFRITEALERNNVESKDEPPSLSIVTAEEGAKGLAYKLMYALRINGCVAEDYLPSNDKSVEEYAKSAGAGAIFYVSSDGKLILDDLLKGTKSETTVSEFVGLYMGDDEEEDTNWM